MAEGCSLALYESSLSSELDGQMSSDGMTSTNCQSESHRGFKWDRLRRCGVCRGILISSPYLTRERPSVRAVLRFPSKGVVRAACCAEMLAPPRPVVCYLPRRLVFDPREEPPSFFEFPLPLEELFTIFIVGRGGTLGSSKPNMASAISILP